MMNLKGILAGVFVLVSVNAKAGEFLCPVPTNFQNLTCEGSVEVKSLTELIAYKSNFAQKKGRAKNVIVDFDINTNALSISTPCKITISEKRVLNINGDLCLHGGLGIKVDESSNLRASNVRLESDQEVIIEKHADLKTLNLEMLSKGHTDDSKAHIRSEANVDVKSLLLEAYNRVSLGGSSTYHVQEGLKLYSRGDDDASVGAETKITAATFELQAYDKAKLGSNVNIKAETVIINSKSCSISNKTIVIDAQEKLGSCFLQSSPKGLFKADVNNGFAPLAVNFDAEKISSTSFIWSFGDAETQTTTTSSVSHIYSRPGTYTVTLKYLKEKKYKSAGSLQIIVKEQSALPPVASIICSTNNLLVNCSGLGSYDPQGQPLNFRFDYADGFTENSSTGLSSHAYTTPGLYLVKLTVVNLAGLSSEATAQVQPLTPPNVLPNLVLNCVSPKPNTLECDSVGSVDLDGIIVTYQYSFDDGVILFSAETNKVTHSFISSGRHLVNLIGVDNDGGITTISKTFEVRININPIADFTCRSEKPFQVLCQSTSKDLDEPDDFIIDYKWNLNDQSINGLFFSSLNYNFYRAGEFPINLTVSDSYGGVGTISKTISVKDNIAPVASFSCQNTGIQNVHCESNSTDTDGQVLNSDWILDDGTNLTGTSFDHFFSSGGSHLITLLATDDLGETSSSENNFLTVSNQFPTVDIFASQLSGSYPLSVNFEARNVTDTDGTIANIKWAFSDGTTGSGANISHIFKSVGIFTAILTVTDNLGAETTQSIDISSLEPLRVSPVVGFKYFENGTTTIELRSAIIKTQFDIDHAFYTIDGVQTVPVIEFYSGTRTWVDLKAFGSHSITLTAVDIRGQTTITSFQFALIKDPSTLKPISDFIVNQSSARTAFFNFNRAFNPDIRFGIKNYHIDYGDGTSEDLTDDTFKTHTYLNSGTYNVNLVVISSQGNGTVRSSTTKSVTVTDQDIPALNPVAAFAYQLNSWALNVTFENEKSGTPNGSIVSYLWDFGDGTTATGAKVAHFFDPGSYLVTLTVTDSAGLRNSQIQHVTITEVGSDLVANIDCGISTAQNQNCNVTALDKFNEISSVSVNWGDGSTSELNEPVEPAQGLYKISKKYFTNGIQTIGLHVSTARGDTRTVTTTKQVILPSPIANLSCTSENLHITCNSAGSSDPSGAGVESYTYDFGNGTVINASKGVIDYNYLFGGSYNVKLSVTSRSGLSSSATTQVIVNDTAPNANLGCYANNMLISCSGIGSYDFELNELSYEFDFGDGYVESSTTALSSHAYTLPGIYNVTLKAIDTNGNIGTRSIQVQALLPPNQLPNLSLNCYSDAPYFARCNTTSSDPDGTIISYKYSWDDNTEETYGVNASLFHIFATGGNHQVTLTITDNDGGVNSFTHSFNVRENHPPVAKMLCSSNKPQNIHCDSYSQDLDSGDLITEYKWDLGNGQVITSMIPSIDYTYQESSTYSISLQLKDTMGATSFTSQDVTTLENQQPIALIDCQNSGLQTISCHTFSFDPDGNIANIHWILDDGFVFSGNAFTHTFMNGEAHSATVTVTDDLGKSSATTQELYVLVNKLPSFEILVDNTSGNLPFLVNFKSLNVVDLDGTVATYKWIFGDGSTSDQAVVSHTYTEAGVYTAKLQVTDNNGGMTERSETIRASAPSNLVIKTDKDSGVANLTVHFDASESTDPEGQLDKFEWFYNGSKVGEGQVLDFVFDEVGVRSILLQVTNNFGVVTALDKSILVSAPAIYLDGTMPKSAVVERELKGQFKLMATSNIDLHNITYSLNNAPSGVSFDQELLTLTWTPSLTQVGHFEFSISATDGVLYTERLIKLDVSAPVLIANLSFKDRNASAVIPATGTAFDNAEIYMLYSGEFQNVNLKVYQIKNGEGYSLWIDPSVKISGTYEIFFPEGVMSLESDPSDFLGSGGSGQNFFGWKLVNNYSSCISGSESIGTIFFKVRTGLFNVGRKFFFTKRILLNSLSVNSGFKLWTSEILTSDDIANLEEIFSDLKLQETMMGRNYNIYFYKDLSEKRYSGVTPNNSVNMFYVNLFSGITNSIADPVSRKKYLADLKHTIYHEFYHTQQARMLNCQMPYRPIGDASVALIEGSADAYGLSRLSVDEKRSWAQNMYLEDVQNPQDIYNPLNVYNFAIKNGLLEGKTSPSSKKDPYRTRHMWAFFDGYGSLSPSSDEFFKFLNTHISGFNRFGFGWDEYFLNFLKTKTSVNPYLASMAAELTRPIDKTVGRYWGNFYTELRDPLLFTGWSTSDDGKILTHLITDGSSQVISSGDIDLPPLSATVYRLQFEKGIGRFNMNYPLLLKMKANNDIDYALVDGKLNDIFEHESKAVNGEVHFTTRLSNSFDVILTNKTLQNQTSSFKALQLLKFGQISFVPETATNSSTTYTDSVLVNCGSKACSELKLKVLVCRSEADRENIATYSNPLGGVCVDLNSVFYFNKVLSHDGKKYYLRGNDGYIGYGYTYYALYPEGITDSETVDFSLQAVNRDSISNSLDFK